MSRRQDALALATFVALGLPDGMLGTAWPSMRQSLHAPVSGLGLVLLAYTAGAVTVTAVVGRVIRRLGVSLLLAGGAAVAVAASAGVAAAPALAAVVAAGLAFGVSGGALDGGLNTAVGMSGRGRLLNLLHGFYGVGTMIGPLLVTVAVVAASWRGAYLVLLVVDAAVAALWLAGRRRDRTGTAPLDASVAPSTAQPAEIDRPGRAAVTAGLAVFFVYTGLEVAAGQWETTFAEGHLHFSSSAAGLATFGYWAALTAVRLGLGAVPSPPDHPTVVRVGTAGAVVAAALIWWEPSAAAAVTGFVLLGASLAGVFPSLVALTPARVGPPAASRVIAWQIGAATAGGAALSALVGLLIQRSGLAVVGPALTAMAVVLVAGEILLRRIPRTSVR